MNPQVPLYAGAVVSILWGVAHIVPTKGVVSGFEPLSRNNRLVLVMEWVAEGLTLVFLGALVLLITALAGPAGTGAAVAYRMSAGMLFVMAVWTAMTAARTPVVFFKICPFVKTLVAGLFLVGSLA